MNTTITIEHIAPTALTIEDNIRTDVALTPEFVQTFRDHGVLMPVLVLRGPSGTLYVRDGQRRTLAAIEAGLATIPAYVAATDDSARIRMIQQLIANEHRTALSDRDRANTYAALSLDGLSAAAIAKQAGTSTKQVKAGITVAKSTAALSALDSLPITLDAALLFAEFEGDEEALASLKRAAEEYPEQLEHTAQRLRYNAARKAQISEAVTRLTVEGYTALNGDDDAAAHLVGIHSLTNSAEDAADKPPITEEEHTSCPGHTAKVTAHYNSAEATVTWCCARGDELHTRRWGNPVKASGPMSDEDKAERKRVIENNRAWDAAESVRGAWIRELLTRKALPKDAGNYIAYSLAVAFNQNDFRANDLALKLLEVTMTDRYNRESGLGRYLEEHPTKAAQVALAVAIATAEAHLSRQSWRTPGAISRRYFQQLDSWGYVLSDVEKIVAGIETA